MSTRLTLIAILLFASCTATPQSVLAEDLESKAAKPLFSLKTDYRDPLFGDRFTLKAGYKVWVAKWQTPTPGTLRKDLNTNSPSAFHGPTVTATYRVRDGAWFNSVVVNITMLRDGFDFSNNEPGVPTISTAVRRDTSITAGLAIWEGFGLFAGYYRNDQRFHDGRIPGVSNGFYTERKLDGLILGGFGTSQVSERVALYGNLAYAMLKFDQKFPQVSAGSPLHTGFDTNSAQGYAIEAGVNIEGPRVWKVGTQLQLGFRSQNITKTFGQHPNPSGQADAQRFTKVQTNDITWGPIFAINAVF